MIVWCLFAFVICETWFLLQRKTQWSQSATFWGKGLMVPSRTPCPEAAARHVAVPFFKCRGDPHWQQIMKLGLGNPHQSRPNFNISIFRKPVRRILPTLSKFYLFGAWPKIVGWFVDVCSLCLPVISEVLVILLYRLAAAAGRLDQDGFGRRSNQADRV